MRGGPLLLLWALLVAGCAATPDPVTPQAVEDLPPPPPGRGAIAGLLVDDVFRPVPGALVLLERVGLTATTDGSGQFRFLDLEPGAYVLVANAPGHEAAPLEVDVTEGQYAEVEMASRRIFSADGTLVTTRYSIFVSCAVSAFVVTGISDCIADLSGDSYRDWFTMSDDPYGANASALVLEMRASQPDGYGISLWCRHSRDGWWSEVDGDYLRVGLLRQNTSKGQLGSFGDWPEGCHELQATLWYLGSDTTGTRRMGITGWGAGARLAMKATFLTSIFVGEPPPGLEGYHPMAPDGGATH